MIGCNFDISAFATVQSEIARSLQLNILLTMPPASHRKHLARNGSHIFELSPASGTLQITGRSNKVCSETCVLAFG